MSAPRTGGAPVGASVAALVAIACYASMLIDLAAKVLK